MDGSDRNNQSEALILQLFPFWEGLTLTNEPGLTKQCWEELMEHYTTPGRAYHNLHHLQQLFKHWSTFRKQLQEPEQVAWAIWYHDIIYNARKRDNEEQSARVAEKRLLALQINSSGIECVAKYIRATAQHMTADTTVDIDLAYFLDFDLAILGTDSESYTVYTEQIRKEYRHVPGFLYRRGRRKILRHFLDAPRLFRTDAFFRMFEEQARENIQMELAKL